MKINQGKHQPVREGEGSSGDVMGRLCVTWAYCRDAQLFLVCLITACAWNVNAWLPSSLSAIVSGCGFGLRFGRERILDWDVGGMRDWIEGVWKL